MAAAAAVFFLVHSPMATELEELQQKNNSSKSQNDSLQQQVDALRDVEKINAALKTQAEAIGILNTARATPANFMFELSQIITPKGVPSMTDTMKARVKSDANRQWSPDWDPKHVWINQFSETGGTFKLQGGAQADRDINELALRLQASVYFEGVRPTASSQARDTGSGVNYYQFTIEGKVKY